MPKIRTYLVLCGLGALALVGCGKSGRITAVLPDAGTDRQVVESLTPSTLQAGDALALDGANARGQGFYPLKIGNRWQYDSRFQLQVISRDTPEPALVVRSRIASRLVGNETLFGRKYVLEESSTEEEGRSDAILSWVRYRQDPAGLYEADIASSVSPGVAVASRDARPEAIAAAQIEARGLDYVGQTVTLRAERPIFQSAWSRLSQRMDIAVNVAKSLSPRTVETKRRRGGVLDHEITRLRYPVFPAANWAIRDDPFFGATVEAHEASVLPAGRFPGYRVRISSPLFGARDEVRVWYGRSGLLRLQAHGEEVATDPSGNVIGTLVFEQEQVLSNIDLVAQNRGTRRDGSKGPSATRMK